MTATPSDAQAEADSLYELPLAEFTAERDALAKRLRANGEREAADEVKSLRKPSVPAWAINRAVRSDRASAKRLLASAETLAAAQEAALAGKGGDLREAMTGQQAAVEAVAEAAAKALGEQAKPAVLDRVRETLRGVAADEELRAEVAAGRVVRDREAVGFGGAASVDVAPRAAGRTKPGKTAKGSGRAKRAKATAAPRGPKKSSELKEAERAVRAAEKALETAEKHAANAAKRLEPARSEFERREAELAEAVADREGREAELAEARQQVERLG